MCFAVVGGWYKLTSMNIKSLFDLTGRVVVVTGGTGFYGKPISEGLAEAGAHVVIASRNQQRCEDWADALRGRGLEASSDAYDQSDDASISSFCERVWNQFGAVDVLVNNSVSRPMTSYEDGVDVEVSLEYLVSGGLGEDDLFPGKSKVTRDVGPSVQLRSLLRRCLFLRACLRGSTNQLDT